MVGVEVEEYARRLAEAAQEAAGVLSTCRRDRKDAALLAAAEALGRDRAAILAANQADLAAAQADGLAAPLLDRLRLTDARLDQMAEGLRQVAELPDPVGEITESTLRPNGMRVSRQRTPLGVIFFIYEARPNVTADAAALCLKSGNAVILRGGKEALRTNRAVHAAVQTGLAAAGLPPAAVQLVATPDRGVVTHLVRLEGQVDVVIPRGGEGLIRAVVAESRVPVLKHYTGNCHTYVDDPCDLAMAERLVLNAKLQRPAVCNAMETLLVHRAVAEALLRRVGPAFAAAGCELRGCPRTRAILPDCKPADEDDWFTEYLALILAVKVVDSLDEAVAHINRYGSKHTDAIVTRDVKHAQQFIDAVDSSSVMVNVSTRMSDGFEYGLGAEIGISTDKLHARGPMGLKELTSTKFVVTGDGQVRG
jgi:glutamate-5-semialdehyde dehydrogenase